MSLPNKSTQWVIKRFEGPSGLEMQEAPIPQLGPQDVLIKVHAVSLNFHDAHTFRGGIGNASEGVVACGDGAGVVVAVGSHIKNFQPGDRVVTVMNGTHQYGPMKQEYIDVMLGNGCDGVLQEFAVVREQYLIAMPRTFSFIEGSTLPVAGLTAWNCLYGAKGRAPMPGQWVLTQGSGGVSTYAILFAKAAGANVIATTSTPEKAKRLKELGADHVINYREVVDRGTQAKALTPGAEGIDWIVDIGGGATLKQSLNAVKMDGLIAVTGMRAGFNPSEEATVRDMFFHFCTLRVPYPGPRWQYMEMNRAIEAHNIKPAIDEHVFNFEEAREAVEYFEGMNHFGKVCIQVAKDI